MATAGKVVCRDTGKRGVLASGKTATYKADNTCAECCAAIPALIEWVFYDKGYIAGGQACAQRDYTDPSTVVASPWTLAPDLLSVLCEHEDDWVCSAYNNCPVAQDADAQVTITPTVDCTLTITYDGEGGQWSLGDSDATVHDYQTGYHAWGRSQQLSNWCGIPVPLVWDFASPHVVALAAGVPHVYRFHGMAAQSTLQHPPGCWFSVNLALS